MKKILSKILGLALILSGIGIYAYPSVNTWLLARQTKQYISEFQEKYSQQADTSGKDTNTKDISEYSEFESSDFHEDSLYKEIKKYNLEIYESGQGRFLNAWSYQQSPISLDGLEDGKFGYIQIPAMDLILPLYIGATDFNMAKGAVVLGQTSVPIGDTDSNAVIAGHRGWSTGDFFLNIEKLSPGDHVYITNPWETLAYQVESIDIIDPYDTDAVKIQKGKDMVTLVTCHPYMSHGKYRYLVYCFRDEEMSDADINENTDIEKSTDKESVPEYIITSKGEKIETSSGTIQKEDLVRKTAATVIIAMVFFTLIYIRIRER